MLNSSSIGRRKLCALTLEFSYQKRVKKPTAQLQTTKPAKFSARANYLEMKLNCECGAIEQTADHVMSSCLIHHIPRGTRGLQVLDEATRC